MPEAVNIGVIKAIIAYEANAYKANTEFLTRDGQSLAEMRVQADGYCDYYVVRNYAINFLLRELPALPACATCSSKNHVNAYTSRLMFHQRQISEASGFPTSVSGKTCLIKNLKNSDATYQRQ
ncbi:hypothetical protein K0M31_009788 [Melipona bicolor]|uniref:Uncharacterized protein n=1 Tax=Melipona bicolor TaxID=60889 RepID=A0AA40KIZ8_9HYME|nr:hypothetical protein K0M31_009788 [Melipona bicolor]